MMTNENNNNNVVIVVLDVELTPKSDSSLVAPPPSPLHLPSSSQNQPPPSYDPSSVFYQCRLCLKQYHNEKDKIEQDFIRPCICQGSLAYMHRECLDKWRLDHIDYSSTGRLTLECQWKAYCRCEYCGSDYQMEVVEESAEQKKHRQDLYTFLVIRDIVTAVSCVFVFLICFSAIIYGLDVANSHYLRHLLPDSIPSVILYFMFSIIISLICIGLMSLLFIWCGVPYNGGGGTTIFYTNNNNNNNNSSNNNSSGGNDGACIFYIVILAILLVIGLILAVYYGCKFLHELNQQHANAVWNRLEISKYRIKSF